MLKTFVGGSMTPGSPSPFTPAYLNTASTGFPPKSSLPPVEVAVGKVIFGPPTAPIAIYPGQPATVPVVGAGDGLGPGVGVGAGVGVGTGVGVGLGVGVGVGVGVGEVTKAQALDQ